MLNHPEIIGSLIIGAAKVIAALIERPKKLKKTEQTNKDDEKPAQPSKNTLQQKIDTSSSSPRYCQSSDES